jgi:hypothetical protein
VVAVICYLRCSVTSDVVNPAFLSEDEAVAVWGTE